MEKCCYYQDIITHWMLYVNSLAKIFLNYKWQLFLTVGLFVHDCRR